MSDDPLDGWESRWPDPEDGKPDEIPTRQWAVYTAMRADPNLSYVDAGELVGVKPGTVSSYLSKLRARYGPGLPRQASYFTDEDRRRGAETNALKTAEAWAEVRNTRAARHGYVAEQLVDAMELVVAEIMSDPKRRETMTLGDVLIGARAVDLLTKSADRLADIDTGKHRVEPGQDGMPPEGLLAGFENSGVSVADLEPGDQVTIKAAELFITSIRSERGEDQPAPIEVAEAS